MEEKSAKKSNVLPHWGNERTMNLNNMVLTNVLQSPYFKNHLFQLKTYHEVVDEIYYKVEHLEPWEKGSRKTAGQVGMCGGVRGVGAGGIVSSAYCLLYKLYTLKLTRKQMNGLLTHVDSPFIRGLGFMYIRYSQPPADLWEWYEPYLEDEEELDVKAGGGCTMTIGQLVRSFLLKLEWYGTLFPRIPVPTQKDIERRLQELNLNDDHRRTASDGWGEAEDTVKRVRGEPLESPSEGGMSKAEEAAREIRRQRERERERDRGKPRSRSRSRDRRRSPDHRSHSERRERERKRSRSRDRTSDRRRRSKSRDKSESSRKRSDSRDRSSRQRSDSRDRNTRHRSGSRERNSRHRSKSRERNTRHRSRSRERRPKEDERTSSKEKRRHRSRSAEKDKRKEKIRSRSRSRERERKKEKHRSRSQPRDDEKDGSRSKDREGSSSR